MKRVELKRFVSLLLASTLIVGLFSPVQGVSAAAKTKISVKKLTLTVGQSKVLTVKTGKKKVKGIKWSSSKKKIATVSSGGKVKAKKEGKTTITAKVKKKKYTCKVTVKKKTTTEKTKTQDTSTTPSTKETQETAPSTPETTPSSPGTTPSTPGTTPDTPSVPDKPDNSEENEVVITDEMKKLITPSTSYEWVERKATRTEDGDEQIIDEEIQKYTVKWKKKDSDGKYHLPKTAAEFRCIDRSGGGKDVDIEEDDGRFLVAALYFWNLMF